MVAWRPLMLCPRREDLKTTDSNIHQLRRRAEPEYEEQFTDNEVLQNENLYRSVDELELSVRSANCLQNANIKLIGELGSEPRQICSRNFGRKSLREIKEICPRWVCSWV